MNPAQLAQAFPVPKEVSHMYASGMGHIEGTDSRSATGMVHVRNLIGLKDLQRTGIHAYPSSAKTINDIADELRAGGQIDNPLVIDYNHQDKWGHIIEGHHRLEAALKAGVTHVPVSVVRNKYGMQDKIRERRGGHLAMLTDFGPDTSSEGVGGTTGRYVPSNIHPYHFKQLMP